MGKFKSTSAILGLSFSLLLAGCGSNEDSQETIEASLGEQLDYTIVGIEPGAGLTELSKDTIAEYENLQGWELLESSTAGMVSSLDQAIKNKEPIIVTGWKPHWKFTVYDLKFLEDPKGTLGGAENYNTLVRKGFEDDFPSAYTVLDNFYWETTDMESIMADAQEVSFEDAAKKWVEKNRDKVKKWIDGVEKVDGQSIEIVSTPWDSERSSSSVLKEVLEQLGYDVTVTTVDPAIMFQAIVTGEADATVAAALPTTHGSFYKKHKEDIVDLGENLKGTQNGFVVPTYMDIDSIEDLEPKE